jgi:large subunit ribosomal protein L17
MNKRVYGRKFNRDINQRKALFRSLMRSLALNESIKTTESKAKAIKGEFESHITKAKRGEEARYHLVKHLSEDAVDRLIKEIAPRVKERAGGYTRIIRLGNRTKDNAEMVLLELVEKASKVDSKSTGKKQKAKKTSTSKKTQTKTSEVTAKVGEKKSTLKPLANIKQMVTRQKKGSA